MFSEYQRDTQSDQIHIQEHTHIHINIGNIARWTSQMFGSITLVSYFFKRSVDNTLSCILRLDMVKFFSEETRYHYRVFY